MTLNKEKYIDLLAVMESGNDYSIKNSKGYLGRYQFGKSTLNALQNKYNLTPWQNENNFLSSQSLQDLYINYLIIDTLDYIKRNDLEKYLNKIVTGSKRFKTITAPLNVYGMLAAAHLAGSNNLKKFLTTGYNPDDGETSLSDYAALFSSKLTGLNSFLPLLLAFIPAIVLYYIQ